jgi:hypothetical protein
MSAPSAKRRFRVSVIARSGFEITVVSPSKDDAIFQAQMAWLTEGESAFNCTFVNDEAWECEEISKTA